MGLLVTILALAAPVSAQVAAPDTDFYWLYGDKLPKPGTSDWEAERSAILSVRSTDPDEARGRWDWLVYSAEDRYKVWKKGSVGGVDTYQDVDGDNVSDWKDLCPGLREDDLAYPVDGCPDDGRWDPYLPGDAKLYAKGKIWSYGDGWADETIDEPYTDGATADSLFHEAYTAWEDLDLDRAQVLLDQVRAIEGDTVTVKDLQWQIDQSRAPAPMPAPAPTFAPAPLPAPAPVVALPPKRPVLPSVDGRLPSGQRRAGDAGVVVGIADYLRLPKVPYADRDAEAFRNWLVYTRGIPLERVHEIRTPASRDHILDAVRQAGREVGPGGTVWIYFAGHGAADPSTGDRMVLGDDAASDLTSFSTRGVTVAELEQVAAAGGGSPVMVLDACFTGAGRGGTELLAGKRIAVPDYARPTTGKAVQWNAASPNEAAGPLEEVQHGAFTYWMVGALRGWADGELTGIRDGKVTGEEAQAYVIRALRSLSIRDQRPVWVGPGDTVLAEGVSEVGPALD